MNIKNAFITTSLILTLLLVIGTAEISAQRRHRGHHHGGSAQTQSQSQNAFNPMISLIGDLVFEYSDIEDYDIEDGFNLSAIDLNFSSSIDVYARADFFFAIEREEEGTEVEYVFELEEGYITFLTLPLNMQLRLGKMRTRIGKVNTMHSHALHWHEYPLALRRFFSDDGLSGLGGDLSVMLPLPFFAEFSYQLQKDESETFISGVENEWYHNFHLKSFFDVGYDHSLELGASYLFAKSDYLIPESRTEEATEPVDSSVLAFNLKYLWQPADRAMYESLLIWAEMFICDNDSFSDTAMSYFAGVDYKFSRRLSIGLKYDHADEFRSLMPAEDNYTASLTYTQSEYAFFRGGYTYVDKSGETESRIFLQLNFGIGPHRAHKF